MHPEDGKSEKRSIRWALLALGVLVAALALAACGSSDSSSSSDSTATETSEATTTEESGGSGEDQESTSFADGVLSLEELYAGSEEEPPTTGPKAAAGKTVVVVSCGQETIGCSLPADAANEAAEALGWTTKVVDGKLNVDNGYSNAVRTAVASNPDAIIPIGINCNEAKTAFQEAKAAGVVIAVNSGIDCGTGDEALWTVEQYFSKQSKDTQEFYEQFGENQAAYIVDKAEGKAKVISTEYLGLFGKAMGKGWEAVFSACAECEVLENLEWEPTELAPNGPLNQRFVTALTKYPEANSTLFAFNTVATYAGLSKAVVDSGRAAELNAVSGEAYDEGNQLIREGAGLTAAAAAYDGTWSSWGVLDNLNRYFSEEPAVPQGVGFVVVDKDHNMPPKGQNYSTKIDFKKSYEAVWGGK